MPIDVVVKDIVPKEFISCKRRFFNGIVSAVEKEPRNLTVKCICSFGVHLTAHGIDVRREVISRSISSKMLPGALIAKKVLIDIFILKNVTIKRNLIIYEDGIVKSIH